MKLFGLFLLIGAICVLSAQRVLRRFGQLRQPLSASKLMLVSGLFASGVMLNTVGAWSVSRDIRTDPLVWLTAVLAFVIAAVGSGALLKYVWPFRHAPDGSDKR